ncbi:hypothetical protein KFK09_019609 [Dendrobium nobile]|uniref:BED-type domain-containing protein n=1 Tax=Dendrobium nobile TaxID=94219 RepID=A0A8T3AQU5_DENNO|nr:hypothetical protein KFK09_019609 [Dendrobium nobile]
MICRALVIWSHKGSAPHRATDVGWAHGTMVNGDRQKIMCRYCQKIILGGGISRLKQHLAGERGNIAPCEKVPDDVKTHIQKHLGFKVLEKLKKQKITEDLKNSLQKARDEGNDGILHKIASRRSDSHKKAKEVDDKSSKKRGAQNTAVGDAPPVQTKMSLKFPFQENVVQADMSVAKFFYIAGIPFSSVNSFYFQKMVDSITAIGPGYKVPSYHSLRGNLLKKCLTETGDFCKEVRKSWDEAGCTIMVDRWINKVGHAMISFYAYSLKGTVFLSSVDASGYENSSEGLSNLFDSIIQEVGPRNVVNFLTDATPSHRAAARFLMNKYQTFFSCICANHCIELILNAIAEMDEVKDIMAKMKKICQVAYNNVWILNSLREKTEGKEVFQHAATEFVAKFSTLLNMVALKEPLQQVFISTSWEQPVLSEQKLGSEVIDILLDLQFWSSCSRIMKVIKPLLAVLHQVDGEERPSMGYFYDSMEKAGKGIISAFDNKESDYHPYLDVIDKVREELHSPLHFAAYYLNPSVYYNSGFVITNVIHKSLLDCIETLETNLLSQDNITRQKSFYEDAVGDFSRPVAIRGRETLSPATWWSLYASDYPDLQRFAIRILSQTCTIMTSQKILFKNEYIQIKYTNKLEIERMKDLTFVRYNLHFLQRHSATSSGSKTSMRNEYDPMCFDGLHSAAVDWLENPGSLELENNSWRNLVLPGDADPTKNNGGDVDDNNLSDEVESNNSSQDSDDTDDSG